MRITVLSTLACLFLIMPTALGQAPPVEQESWEKLGADELYTKAREAYGVKDFDQALQLLNLAYKKDPQPLYIFNQGRVLESMGQYGDAHATYLRVMALSGSDEKLKALAQARSEKVKPLANKVILKFIQLAPGAIVQIGARVLPDPSQDQILEPGFHLICVTQAGGEQVDCWERTLKTGVVTNWPFAGQASSRGTLQWDMEPAPKQLAINGTRLLVNLIKLRAITMDLGTHTLEVTQADQSKAQISVDLLPSSIQSVADAFAQSKTAPVSPTNAVDAAVTQRSTSGAGIWPWLLVGSGAAMAGGGVGLLLVGRGDKDAVESPTKVNGVVLSSTQKAAQSDWDSAKSKISTGYALIGVGSAIAIGGFMWWIMDSSVSQSGRVSENTTSLWFAPSTRGFVFGGAF